MLLKEALSKKKFIVTSEVQTPMGDDNSDELLINLKNVRGRVDGISIVENDIEGIVSDSVKVCEVLKQNRFNAIYQTTMRDKNRIQLQKDLFSAHFAGVENLLVFTEDYRITGDSLQESMFFHVDSGKLASVIEPLRDGRTFDGREINSSIDFIIGAGIESLWGRNIPKQGMDEMEKMKEIGTGYFLTTPVFDLDQFYKFREQIKTFDVPVIAEVMILQNPSVAKFINRHFRFGLVPDWVVNALDKSINKKKASIELFTKTVSALREICDGIHIVTFGGIKNIKDYLDSAQLM